MDSAISSISARVQSAQAGTRTPNRGAATYRGAFADNSLADQVEQVATA
ncbi:hypothetical protein HZU40_25490 [Mycolicibacterium fluoranthenivorans]|uniref:Uncharacterized protein n=1 Tax=Mycolicibacterium fluoranthenivorans TaxID=258505 RepID=A0A7G8PB01_9MYCO|nr:hypothetical protein [Mycolicibacterium fluoranthenivorans]QNJ91517.1 hypothetical protein HZU40_25490 [Mycolicibacterium fluoranthenivorans]